MKNYFKTNHFLFLGVLLFMVVGVFYFNSTPSKVEAACSATDQYPDPASPYPQSTPIPHGVCHTNCYTGDSICHCNPGYHLDPNDPDGMTCIADTSGQMSGALSPDQASCTIATGASRCNQTLTWTTTNPVATSSVSNSGGATPNPGTSINNGSQSFSIPYTAAGVVVGFSLKNNNVVLDQSIVTARCAVGATWDGSKCVISTLPNLTASSPIPAVAAPGVAQTFSSNISNIGNASTGTSFSNFFQVSTGPNGAGTITDLAPTTMSALAAGANSPATKSYTFSSAGTYSIRACADKTDRNSTTPATGAVITESNENDNCSGAWTNVNVTNNMFGTLTATNCTIQQGNSTCNTSLNWSTTNPVLTSAVTSSYPSANTIVANGNSGTNVSALVPYSSRVFYLYNNAIELATATATATCVSGSAWNGDNCVPSPISVSLFADPAGPLAAPASATLTWSITGTPDGCTASNAWTGSKAQGNGVHSEGQTGLVTGTYLYTISCEKYRSVTDDTVTVTASATVIVGTGGGDTNADCGTLQYTCVSPTATVSNKQSYPTIRTWICTSGDGTVSKNCSVRSGSPGFIEN